MDSGGAIVSFKGVVACLGGAALYWLSRSSGRDAATLKSAKRINELAELASILDNGKKVSPFIVAVVGKVGSDSPITWEGSNLKGVIVEQMAERHFLKHSETGSWVQDSVLMVATSKEVPWYLEDASGKAMIFGARSAFGLELPVASEVFEECPSSLVRGTLDYLQGLKMLGVKKVERVLPIGMPLTVVGEAVRDEQGSVRIQRPHRGSFYVSSKSLEQLISTLGRWSRLYTWLSIGCTAMGVWLLARHTLHRMGEKRRRMALRRRVLEAAAQQEQHLADGQRSNSEADGEKPEGILPDLCVICLEQKYTAVFVPCGHMCCCSLCSAQLSNCPLCRRHIDQVVRAYRH